MTRLKSLGMSTLLIIILLILSNGIKAVDIDESSLRGFVFNMDEKVTGEGFFSSYQNASVSNLQLGNFRHGSGSYNYEQLLGMRDRILRFDENQQDYLSSSDRQIDLNEDVDFVYAPYKFALGKTFRSGAISSLGAEKTLVRNYGNETGVSMDARFDSLKTLSKNVTASLYWKSAEVTESGLIKKSINESGSISLNIDTAFSGRAHVGSLEVNRPKFEPALKRQGLHNVIQMTDEDYTGTYSLVRKMKQEYIRNYIAVDDQWLPCPCGSVLDAIIEQPDYFKGSKGFGSNIKSIFDCTCPNVLRL